MLNNRTEEVRGRENGKWGRAAEGGAGIDPHQQNKILGFCEILCSPSNKGQKGTTLYIALYWEMNRRFISFY